MNKQSPFSFMAVTIIKLVVVATVIYYVYQASVVCYIFGYRILNEPPLSASTLEISITVKETDSVYDVATTLEEKRLIADKNIFFCQEWFSKYEGDIQPGNYELSPSMTGDEMIQIMAASKEE